MPKDASLNKKDITLFIKRLRKHLGESKISFLQCGEYGEQNKRPHHHAAIFGYEFKDKKPLFTRGEYTVYTSDTLDRIWSHGQCSIGALNFESAAYIARYITKKITGEAAKEHYGKRLPEFQTMSRRPAIGKTWWDKYKKDVTNYDTMVIRPGMIQRPPKYFDRLHEVENPKQMERIKKIRKTKQKELTYQRLETKERIVTKNLKQNLKRSI